MKDIIFIAEIGLNHNGDINLAKKLIDGAKAAGAQIAKFQSITAEKLVSTAVFDTKIDGFGLEGVSTVGEFWQKVSIDEDFHKQIYNYCDEVGIEFMSTPFDEDNVDLLERLGVKRYKIASGDITYSPLISKIAKLHKPIILSTGMANLDEIGAAVDLIKSTGNEQITLLHCVSLYPTSSKQANLNAIGILKDKFDLPVGFSDHTLGYHIPLAAIAKGATMIEKHFTLDRTMPGPDQEISCTPKMLKLMIEYGKEIQESIAIEGVVITQEEIDTAPLIRRNIVAAVDLKSGTVLEYSHLGFKRQGGGISPVDFSKILGRKLNKDIENDQSIEYIDLDD